MDRFLSLLIVAVLLGGCSNELSKLSDNALQDRMNECAGASSLSPGKAISCENYERECKRRREEGRFVC